MGYRDVVLGVVAWVASLFLAIIALRLHVKPTCDCPKCSSPTLLSLTRTDSMPTDASSVHPTKKIEVAVKNSILRTDSLPSAAKRVPSDITTLPTQFTINDVIFRYDNSGRFDELFTEGSYRAFVPEFLKVWAERPFKDNKGGMDIHHMFGLFYTAKIARPQVILESGVWKGMTSWLLRKAAPQAKIFAFDPRDQTFPGYEKLNVTKVIGRNFVDLARYDFSGLSREEKNHTLVLLDDHQAHLPRLQLIKKLGFVNVWVVFDDNWQPHHGDLHSAKMLMDPTGSPDPQNPYTWGSLEDTLIYKSNFGRSKRTITVAEHRVMASEFRKIVDFYVEVPPLAEFDYRVSYPKAITDKISPKPLYTAQTFRDAFPGYDDILWEKQVYVNMGAVFLP